jgi:hypothetical protein
MAAPQIVPESGASLHATTVVAGPGVERLEYYVRTSWQPWLQSADLEGNCSDLCGNCVHRMVIIGFYCRAQQAKCIVVRVWEGRGITLVPGRCCRGVEAALKCLLDDAAELDSRLVCGVEEVPTFKGPNIQAGSEKEADGHKDQLCLCVRIAAKDGNFSAIFDATEQYFMSIGSGVCAAKDGVVYVKGGRHGSAINQTELINYIDHPHARMPPSHIGDVG